MDKLKRKFGVFYTDGGWRDYESNPGGGHGIHGYVFDELESVKFAKAPILITPSGYVPKPTGAQQKDESYNPSWSEFGYSIEYRDGGKSAIKESASLVIIDGVIPNGNTTAQYNELDALISLIEKSVVECEHYIIYSDSQYLVNGWNNDLANWKARNWKTSAGTPVKNLELWQAIDSIKERFGDKLSLRKIEAHAGHYGNEMSDTLATAAIASQMAGAVEPYWNTIDKDYSLYWEPVRPIPKMINWKYWYSFTDTDVVDYKVDDKVMYEYLIGDHTKTDEVDLLCKRTSDVGFALVLHNEKIDLLEKVRNYHDTHLWGNTCDMYRSKLVNVSYVSSINTAKVAWNLYNLPMAANFITNGRRDVMDGNKNIISKVLRPPKLSLRITDYERDMRDALLTTLLKLGKTVDDSIGFINLKNLEVTDLTETFYKAEVKKDGKLGANKLVGLRQTDRAFTVELNNSITKPVKRIYTVGIDTPTYHTFTGITDLNPKVYAVSWPTGKRSLKTALVLLTDESYGIWVAPFGNSRLLNDDE